MKIHKQNILKISLMTAFVFMFSAYSTKVFAEPLEDRSDTMSRLGNSSSSSVPSDHTIQFTTPTGVASTETVVVTFPSDFDGSNDPAGALDYTDVDLLIDDVPDGTCDGTTQTLVASSAGADEWDTVFGGTENRVLTFTSGGASAIVGAGYEVCIKIGDNATGGTTNSQYINPTTSGSFTITLSVGDGADTGDVAVRIIDNDRVTISARVNETITFTIADYSIGFGDLTSVNARFATADEVGADGPTSTSAHNMTVSTNGSSGYGITYVGSTLSTTTGDDIDVATITGDEDGTPDSEQFAIGFVRDTDATIVSAYNQVSPNFNYSFVEDTETPFVSEDGPSLTETISAFYLANISGITPAGAYSTSLTYVATANF